MDAPTTPQRPPETLAAYDAGQRRRHVLAVFAFLTLAAAATYRIGLEVPHLSLWGLAAVLILSWLAADFVSGFVHWMGDTWGSPDMPVLGPGFVRPFREHHVDPMAITRHDWIQTNGNNCLVSLPLLPPIALTPLPAASTGWTLASLFILTLTLWVFATNQIHSWAHDDNPPQWVRLLQRTPFILSPAHHAVHHAAPYDKYYCITSGILNAPLQRVGFFRRTEALVTRLTGLVPRRDEKGIAPEGSETNAPPFKYDPRSRGLHG